MSGFLSRTLLFTRSLTPINYVHTTSTVFAARKGTREKARKKKVKVEVKKIGFIPHNLRNVDKLKNVSRRSFDKFEIEPLDAVYALHFYKTKTYEIKEALQLHRETNHPSMFNRPNAAVTVEIELNMVAEKKTRFMDSFNRIVGMPHPFASFEDRTVLAFCKTSEQVDEANEAGADLAGGVELVQRIQTGDVSLNNYRFVVCHSAVFPELVPIRGLLKKKFPIAKNGTLGSELSVLIKRFKKGLQYRCEKDADEHDLGKITAQIGYLNMSDEMLEENFATLVRDVESVRPKRSGDFITWVWCHAKPSPEKLKLQFAPFLEQST